MAVDCIFDITKAKRKNWWFVFVPAGVFGAVLMLVAIRSTLSPEGNSSGTALGIGIMASFAALWCGLAWYSITSQYSAFLKAWSEGKALKAEGLVEQFNTSNRGGTHGRGVEKFRVGDTWFRYQTALLTAGFNQTQAKGGPMREGLRVRIWYVSEPTMSDEMVARMMRKDSWTRFFVGSRLEQLAAEGGFVDNHILRLEIIR